MTVNIHTPKNSGVIVPDIDKRAFVAYYNEKSIIPVGQDLDDPDFIFKRNSLYKLLGIPLSTLQNKRIIEFGPGGGYNATAIAHFEPESYVFVDAAKASLQELSRKSSAGLFGNVAVKIVESNIFDYSDTQSFDLVVVEGVVPGQTKPAEMLRHVGSFVRPNGHLVTTTTSATSLLSEVCRRLFRPFISFNRKSFDDQLVLSEKIFESHLKSLGTKTRPTRDWVLDSILHDWESGAKVIFSMVDASQSLGADFDFFGSSPKFLVDDRFYKKIDRSAENSNNLLVKQFPTLSLALLDYRVSFLDTLGSAQGLDIEGLCTVLFDTQIKIIGENSYDKLDDFFYYLRKVEALLPEVSTPTTLAIDEFIRNFQLMIDKNNSVDFPTFSRWWGRGQQYVSFMRIA